jgi:hypothetical protein
MKRSPRSLSRGLWLVSLTLLGWASLQGTVWASSKQNAPEPVPEAGANWVPGYAIVLLGIALGLLVTLRSSNRQDANRGGAAGGMTPEELRAAAEAAKDRAAPDRRGMARAMVGVKSGRREDVRAVAVYQKGILVCILIQILGVVGLLLTRGDMRGIVFLAVMIVAVAQTVFVFLLSKKVYSTGMGILMTILALVPIPIVYLVALFVVNSKATSVLRQNGHEVGLLGAKLSDF